jgi:hypothetical protein
MQDTPIPVFGLIWLGAKGTPFSGPENRFLTGMPNHSSNIPHLQKPKNTQIKMEHQNVVEPQFNANIPPPSIPQQQMEQSPPAPQNYAVPPPPPPHREHQNQSRDVYGIQYRDAPPNNGQQKQNNEPDHSEFKVE